MITHVCLCVAPCWSCLYGTECSGESSCSLAAQYTQANTVHKKASTACIISKTGLALVSSWLWAKRKRCVWKYFIERNNWEELHPVAAAGHLWTCMQKREPLLWSSPARLRLWFLQQWFVCQRSKITCLHVVWPNLHESNMNLVWRLIHRPWTEKS